jgi:hypothetical protein
MLDHSGNLTMTFDWLTDPTTFLEDVVLVSYWSISMTNSHVKWSKISNVLNLLLCFGKYGIFKNL